jgi:hypothetical protein
MKNRILKYSFCLCLGICFVGFESPALAQNNQPLLRENPLMIPLLITLGINLILAVWLILEGMKNKAHRDDHLRSRGYDSARKAEIANEIAKIKGQFKKLTEIEERIKKLETDRTENINVYSAGIKSASIKNFGSLPEPNNPTWESPVQPSPPPSSLGVEPLNHSPSSNPWDNIIETYNRNPEYLESLAFGVAETEQSLQKRRQNSSLQKVTLNQTTNSSYWVIAGLDARSYWVVPKSGLKLGPVNFDTFQSLFKIQDYRQNLPFRLIKPAQVEQTGSGEWVLMEKGEICQ